ncbi:MAG: pilus assembly protein [Methylotenera sp.]|nr:pilus assembly protein [Oligoflexia bacterium]
MRLKILRSGHDSGQATLEFALALSFFMAIMLFYIQLSMSFAWGNYVHYATFMSARAYLAAGTDEEDQQERAKSVLVQMVKKGVGREGADRFASIAKGVEGGSPVGAKIGAGSQFSPTDRNLSWLQGVRYKFRGKLFMIPFAGSAKAGKEVNYLTLTSESWLGREPTTSECTRDMGQMGITDNGC